MTTPHHTGRSRAGRWQVAFLLVLLLAAVFCILDVPRVHAQEDHARGMDPCAIVLALPGVVPLAGLLVPTGRVAPDRWPAAVLALPRALDPPPRLPSSR